ncbi:MAG TPA: cyclic nucleotide-binding domain-containing protein [Azospirillaceae bacterium]|nr:cyclic nucleotide-binding domain-containing protein [Azospirillaceae bacterium]
MSGRHPGVRQEAGGRRRLVLGLALLCALATGLPRAFTAAAAQSTFLDRVGPELVPVTYLAMAACMPLLGAAYSRLAERLPLLALSALLSVADAAVLACLWAGLSSPLAEAAAWGTGLWYQLEWALTSLVTWIPAARLLTLREGQRWFGWIAAGGLLAQGLAGLAVGPLLGRLEPADLLLLSACGALAGLPVLALLSRLGGDPAPRQGPAADRGAPAEGLAAARRLFPLMAGGSILVYFLAEYLFLNTLALHVTEPERTAAFLGNFSAAEGFLCIAASLAAPLVMRRAGLPAALALLPGSLVLGGLAAAGVMLAAGPLHPAALAVATGALLADAVLRYTIDRQAGLVLLQPLPPRERTALQVRIESMVEPAACGIAGAGLLALAWLGGGTGALVPVALLVAGAAAWRFGLGVRAHALFRVLLAEAIRRRDLPAAELRLDGPALDLAADGLRAAQPGRILYALALLREQAPERLEPALPALLAHGQAEVRAAALEACAEQPSLTFAPVLAARLAAEPEPGLAVAAGRLLDPAALPAALAPLVPVVAGGAAPEAAVAALLAHGGAAEREAARGALEGLVAGAPEGRRAAVRVVAAVGCGTLEPVAARLLDDPDREVRRAALGAAAALGTPALAARIVAEIVAGRVGRDALDELAAFGPAAVPPIARALAAGAPRPALRVLLEGLAAVGTPEALALAAARLEGGPVEERRLAAAALARAGHRHADPGRLWPVILEEAALYRRVGGRATAASAVSGLEALAAALAEEAEAQRGHVLALLGLATDPARAGRARRSLAAGTAEERAIAAELVEGLVPRRHRRGVMEVVEPGAAPTSATPAAGDLLEAILREPPAETPDWLAALAAHIAGVTGCAGARLDAGLDTAERRGGHVAASVRRARRRMGAAGEGQEEGALLTVEKVFLLRAAEIFAGVPQAQLAGLADHAEAVDFPAGALVFAEGDPGDALYVIADGRVAVERGGRVLAELGPAEMVGEMAALDPEPRSATVRCLEPARLLRIGHGLMGQFIDDYPDVARSVIRLLIRRLRRANAMAVAAR